ncbi:hypothetical protein N9242_06490 [Vicingaceae bacterium]|jgi:hypothetical protein|nr:hypothetical protein [Vicingaceae bacterium]MDB4558175.1 hypothetical protein [Akkermansiaceae bacterium]
MEEILHNIHTERGLLWESIEDLRNHLAPLEETVEHHTEDMQDLMPVTHKLENGLYTREVFMPAGQLVVSFIHKQNHPSFFMEGEMSLLMDTGEVKRVKAPMVVHTEAGTQRVAVIHEDTRWACVYRTDAKTIEEAEKEVYTMDFRELPESVIQKKLCQE